ncbi:hypothetical protein B0T14DRAFT_498753 [Immersiella caudata]|uniref:Uncharacterized protein n=1 Tax=Immersiella caudata TaxID=314043 RepID=A0AA39U642_9PEZI|nr:hypothetical protein B0T14DRAFT_498753 [Immersiella caudata]
MHSSIAAIAFMASTFRSPILPPTPATTADTGSRHASPGLGSEWVTSLNPGWRIQSLTSGYREYNTEFSSAIFDQFRENYSPNCYLLSIWGTSRRTPKDCTTDSGSGPAGHIIPNSIVAVHLMFYYMNNAVFGIKANGNPDLNLGAEFGFMGEQTHLSSEHDINKLRPVLIETVTNAALYALAPGIKLCKSLPHSALLSSPLSQKNQTLSNPNETCPASCSPPPPPTSPRTFPRSPPSSS